MDLPECCIQQTTNSFSGAVHVRRPKKAAELLKCLPHGYLFCGITQHGRKRTVPLVSSITQGQPTYIMAIKLTKKTANGSMPLT